MLIDKDLFVLFPVNSTAMILVFKKAVADFIQIGKSTVLYVSVSFLPWLIDLLKEHCHIKHTLIQQVQVGVC